MKTQIGRKRRPCPSRKPLAVWIMRCLQVMRVAAMAKGLAATLVDNSLRGRCVDQTAEPLDIGGVVEFLGALLDDCDG